MALVPKEEIKAKIERADLVKETIQLSIANIDHALSSKANTNTVLLNLPMQPNLSASTATEHHSENGSSHPSASWI